RAGRPTVKRKASVAAASHLPLDRHVAQQRLAGERPQPGEMDDARELDQRPGTEGAQTDYHTTQTDTHTARADAPDLGPQLSEQTTELVGGAPPSLHVGLSEPQHDRLCLAEQLA